MRRSVELVRKGFTYSEVAAMLGVTRSAVAGAVYRERNGSPERKVMPTKSDIFDALLVSGGNVTEAAAALGVSTNYIASCGFRSTLWTKRPNLATDPATRAIVEEIDDSGLSARFIADELEMSRNTIYKWRRGRAAASPFLMQCVRSVIDARG